MEISQIFVTFSEYMNFMRSIWFEITQREPVTSQSVSEGSDYERGAKIGWQKIGKSHLAGMHNSAKNSH